MIRRFRMNRVEDASGVSGTGHVADGCVFEDGTTVVRWRTEHRSTTVYASIDDVVKIHGHGGKTRVEFDDHSDEETWICCMCFDTMDVGCNHCFTCGAGSSAIATTKVYAAAIQRHDKERLDSIQKRDEELAALRRLAFDVMGIAAGFFLVLGERDGKVVVTGISTAGSNTTYCGNMREGQSELDFLVESLERVPLPPKLVRTFIKPLDPNTTVLRAPWGWKP